MFCQIGYEAGPTRVCVGGIFVRSLLDLLLGPTFANYANMLLLKILKVIFEIPTKRSYRIIMELPRKVISIPEM